MLQAEKQSVLRACRRFSAVGLFIVAAFAIFLPDIPASGQAIGLLEGHKDIGTVLHPGDTTFDPKEAAYKVTGSGDNLWFTADEMQFAWKRIHGDVALTAEIEFVGAKGNNHRKAALMIRQSLDPDSAYADVARHGDGLTSLQFRLATSEVTREVETAVTAPHWVRIEKRGSFVHVFVGDSQQTLKYSGASMRLPLSDDFYVGLAVCSHDKDVTETAIFRHFQIDALPPETTPAPAWSTLETVKVASTDRRVAYVAQGELSAPNWSRDGSSIVLEQNGTLQRFVLDPAPYPSLSAEAAQAKKPEPLEAGLHFPLESNHGFSPDGSQLAVSAVKGNLSRLFILSLSGGAMREIQTDVSAGWGSWSPDGLTLAFTGRRGDDVSIYSVPVSAGHETRLTSNAGENQSPAFSVDGKWIYFSSSHTGHFQLWRMHTDGSGQEQLLSETGEDVYPHSSPDGKSIVYLALPSGARPAGGKQPGELRLLSLSDGKTHLLATLQAGAGSIPAQPWSPDSARVTFISYATVR